MSNTWADKHKQQYAGSDWLGKPSIFARTAVEHFPKAGRVLELGAGQGQDSRFFAERGYEVVSSDYARKVLNMNKAQMPDTLLDNITLQLVDLRRKLPFPDASFDAVYAHLSLHYFDMQTTRQIFTEISRVLRPRGILACLVNSTSDPEYGTGTQLEPGYFRIDGMPKRFFAVESIAKFTKDFEMNLLDDRGESYKDMAKGVHGLIRCIGTKPV